MNVEFIDAINELNDIKNKYYQLLNDNIVSFKLMYNLSKTIAADLDEVFAQKKMEDENFNFTDTMIFQFGELAELYKKYLRDYENEEESDTFFYDEFGRLYKQLSEQNVIMIGRKNFEDVLNSKAYIEFSLNQYIDYQGQADLFVTYAKSITNMLIGLINGGRLIFIAHSQGNLFANDIVNAFINKFPELKKSLSLVSIATPASEVTNIDYNNCYQWPNDTITSDKYCYTTTIDDAVIKNLAICTHYDVLPPNVDNLHGYIMSPDEIKDFDDRCVPLNLAKMLSPYSHSLIRYLNSKASGEIITTNITKSNNNLIPPDDAVIQGIKNFINRNGH